MRHSFILCFLMLVSAYTFSQQKNQKPEEQIRLYWFVMLKKGPNRTHDSTTAAQIQAGHMENMNKIYYDGKLKVAGPFGDDGDWRGVFILDCATKEEAEELVKKDPAVVAGRLSYEIHPWYTAPTGNFAPGKPKKEKD